MYTVSTRRDTGDYPQGLELVAAIVERARLDCDDDNSSCPVGDHKAHDCAATLVFAIDTFASKYDGVDASEYAITFFRLVEESNGG